MPGLLQDADVDLAVAGAAMLAVLALITFVPEVVLWLPRLLGYQG